MNQKFYLSMENMLLEVLKKMKAYNLLDEFRNRVKRLQELSEDMGFSVWRECVSFLGSIFREKSSISKGIFFYCVGIVFGDE